MTEVLIVKNTNKKKLAVLMEKAKEIGLELTLQKDLTDRELTKEEEKEAFLFTSKMNAARIFAGKI